MSNELKPKQSKLPAFATPENLDQAMRLAEMMAKSDLVPNDYRGKPGNCIIAMQMGAELGLAPMQAIQNIAVINGRPAVWGDALLGLVRGSGLLESINEDASDTVAVCTVKRVGCARVIREFTIEDAKRAGLAGKQGPWQQYPKRMLQMRARAFALRDAFPDVLKGLYMAEEAIDIPQERDVAPQAEEKATAGIERVKQKLAQSAKPKAEIEVVVDEAKQSVAETIKSRIEAATSIEQLYSAIDGIDECTDEEKKELRSFYKSKAIRLKKEEESK